MTEENEIHSAEKVGYGRPPTHSRWTKGQSGNKHGRPRGSQNTYRLLNLIAEEGVKIVQPNGKTMQLSKKQVALMKAMNSACNGDIKALQMLLPHLIIADQKADEQNAKIMSLKTDDARIIQDFIERSTNGNFDIKTNNNEEKE